MDQQLLPGIPDVVTLNEIVPKLSGTAFHISAISRAWLHAARSYEIYNSRVQSHSTETHVIVTYDRPGRIGPVTALYNMKDNYCVELPSVPKFGGRIFQGYHFVSSDGKIYVLGGWPDLVGNDEVYVLDLRACETQWKQCASMTKPTKTFRCGVIKKCGKIYVIEGFHDKELEVYEPKENIWSRVSPVTYRYSPFSHRYRSAEKQTNKEAGARKTENRVLNHEHILGEEFSMIEEGWRVIGALPWGRHFVASGKNYSMTIDGIFNIDGKGPPLERLHSFSLPVLVPDTGLRFCNSKKKGREEKDTGLGVLPARNVTAVQQVENELLAMVSYTGEFDDESDRQFQLLRTTGFGGKSEEIVWRRVQFPISWGISFHYYNTLRFTIRL